VSPRARAVAWPPALAPDHAAQVAPRNVGCPSPEPDTNWRVIQTQPSLCRGRYEGTEVCLGRRGCPNGSLHSPSPWRLRLDTCLVPPRQVGPCPQKARQNTRLTADYARPWTAEKTQKTAPREICPLTQGARPLVSRGCDRSCEPGRWVSQCAAEQLQLHRYWGCTTVNGHVLRA
jgi:hypothetical protein